MSPATQEPPWAGATSWGRWNTPDGEVTMLRRGQRVRFYSDDNQQIGPEHANVLPAFVSAHDAGWWDMECAPMLQLAVKAEIRANTRRP